MVQPFRLSSMDAYTICIRPRIMTSIVCKVLSLDDRVHHGTDHYIDDIVVQESVVDVGEVRAHLIKYGLETKELEDLDGGRLLGIALTKDSRGHLHMSRDRFLLIVTSI